MSPTFIRNDRCLLCNRSVRDEREHVRMHAKERPTRESMYVDAYLDGPAYTIGTFLAYSLRGEARRWSDVYARALQRALWRREARGEVVPTTSVGGGLAYRRRE